MQRVAAYWDARRPRGEGTNARSRRTSHCRAAWAACACRGRLRRAGSTAIRFHCRSPFFFHGLNHCPRITTKTDFVRVKLAVIGCQREQALMHIHLKFTMEAIASIFRP